MDVVGLETWQQRVPLMAQGYHQTLMEQVAALRETTTVYPPADQVFSALTLTPFEAVQVVIVGQDPYHGPGQAHGLAFSVPEGVRTPPSLRNIFKEIRDDVYDDDVYDDDVYGGEPRTFSSDLTRWAEQGVLLLNAALTVEAGEAGSHRRLGWHRLTDQIIAQVSEQHEHRVFMLWGRHAQSKRQFIDGERHLVLEAAHPSPFSAHRGFFGCRHFSQANAYLAQHGGTPIDW